MTITQSESGLSAGVYAALSAATNGSAYKVIAHKYNLDFALGNITPSQPTSNATDNYDAATVIGKGMVRIVDDLLQWFTLPAADATGPYSVTGVDSPFNATGATGVAPSVADMENGNVGYCSFDATGIYFGQAANVAAATSGTLSKVLTETNIVHVALVPGPRIHYVVKNATKNTYQLKMIDGANSWGKVESDIHYQYPIESFDAVALSSSPAEDVITMVSQVPGNVKIRWVNNEVQKTMEPAGGVMAFRYQYGTWSDHFEIEVFPNMTAHHFRRDVKTTLIDDTIFCTVFSVDGTEDYQIYSIRHYTSKDGRNWTLGDMLPMPQGFGQYGMVLARYGDYVYGVQGKNIYISDSTLYTGHSPSNLQADITDYIDDYTLDRSPNMQAAIVLNNSDGYFDNHAFINDDNVIALQHQLGYQLTAGNPATLIDVGLTEVDVITWSTEASSRMIKLVARDRMSWLSTLRQSEEAHYSDGQLTGGDEYNDNTGTSYGGLRHSGVQSGSWSSDNDELNLKSNNREGVCFSTFGAYIWNGGHQSDFSLATSGNDEYAGLVFRAPDKDNCWFVYYNQSADKIQLIRRINAEDTVMSQTSAMSWKNTPTTRRYLRVNFRYGRIRVYSSTDGISWTEEITYIAPGQHTSGVDVAVMDKGFCGFLGKGYSPEDTWSIPDLNIDPIYWIPPTWDFEIPLPALPGYEPGLVNYALMVNKTGKAAFTQSWTSDIPYYVEITGFTGSARAAVFDPFCDFVINDGDSGALKFWLISQDGTAGYVYRCDDALADEIELTQIHSFIVQSDVERMGLWPSLDVTGALAVGAFSESGGNITYSSDGSSFTDSAIGAADDNQAQPGYRLDGENMLRHGAGYWYYKDTWASSWSLAAAMPEIAGNDIITHGFASGDDGSGRAYFSYTKSNSSPTTNDIGGTFSSTVCANNKQNPTGTRNAEVLDKDFADGTYDLQITATQIFADPIDVTEITLNGFSVNWWSGGDYSLDPTEEFETQVTLYDEDDYILYESDWFEWICGLGSSLTDGSKPGEGTPVSVLLYNVKKAVVVARSKTSCVHDNYDPYGTNKYFWLYASCDLVGDPDLVEDKLYKLNDYENTPTWTDISPTQTGKMIHMFTKRNYQDHLACIGKDTYGNRWFFRTQDGGNSWLASQISNIYSGCYITFNNDEIVIYGDGRIQTIDGYDKRGNLEEIWATVGEIEWMDILWDA